MLTADPPEHKRFRGLVNKAFTPRRVNRLEAGIEELADTLIDAFEPAGEFEVAIPWAMLGLDEGGPAPGEPLRLAMYTTQNHGGYDVYDSGPGLGNAVVHEQIGDNPGDPDSSRAVAAAPNAAPSTTQMNKVTRLLLEGFMTTLLLYWHCRWRKSNSAG